MSRAPLYRSPSTGRVTEVSSSDTVGPVANPAISTDVATKSYVDNAIAGVNPASAVQAATTASSDTSGLTYSNGVGGIGATFTGVINTPLTVDGFTFTSLGQRLLVKNDTQSPSGAFNGIYYVTQLQTIGLAVILTRALDYNQPSDINNTGAIPVVNGTVNGTTQWVLTSQVTTVGTDPLTYAEFSINPSSILLKDGSVAMTGALNLNSHRINNVTDPSSPQDAATKAYTDSTANTANATQIRGKTVDNDTPVTGDAIYFHSPTWGFGMGGFPTRSYRYDGNGTTLAAVDHFGTTTAMTDNPTTGTANKATATEPPLLQMSPATTASPNSFGIVEAAALGTNTGIFNRFRARIKIGAYGSNTRYWIGLFGQTSLAIIGNATWVTNTPTTPGIAFRASNGTDTNWQCVTTTGSSQTTTDSGVAVSTAASHVFEFSFDGTNVRFYIDGALVATQSTNVPTASSTLGNSSLVGGILADNRNLTATLTYSFSTLRIIDLS